MNQLKIIMAILSISLLIIIIVPRLNLKQKVAGRIGNNGTKDVKMMVPLKYLSSFWRTPEMLLINFEINLILTWSQIDLFY